MTKLPAGTVAFLKTDIEGSTRLVGLLGDVFPELLNDHFALLDKAVNDNGGTLVSSEGDSSFAVFPSTRQAIAAAVLAQRELGAHRWPDGAAVSVRMGIHAGEAVFGGHDYTGIDVHRTARIMAAGHGSQVLVSEAAHALAGGGAADGIHFRDLGSHRLRDLPAPEHLYQLIAPGLRDDFPGLRTEPLVALTNLPASLTRFFGRARELAEVRDLMTEQRMVTLTGPGGSGKTRLAIETARTLLDLYVDGVTFVALEVVRDPAIVLPTIAATLRVVEQPGSPIATVLAEFLASRRQLLVLDNLEQVIDAAPDIAALLQAAPDLAVLVTSREPLSISGEHVYQVPPLALPAEPGVPTAGDIAANEAVELFVARARAARSDFSLSDANAPAIAAICRRLDGLPLAIELAAARINFLSPDEIVVRLDHRLALLTASRRDLPERQRTLRGAIDWSYDLLAGPEQAFFRRLSVFAGGAELDAIRAVVDPVGTLGSDALDLASALVDRSLLRSTRIGDGNRLDMLETIREYAAEHLAASPEEESEAIARHATYYGDLAEASEGLLTDVHRDELLDRLDRELANFRAAIAWSLEARLPETGLRIATALREFWHMRNHLSEGRRALDELLAASAEAGATSLRLRALTTGGGLAGWHGDYGRMLELFEDAAAMAEATSDRRLMAVAKAGLGSATLLGSRPEAARAYLEEAIELARELDAKEILFMALNFLTLASIRLGDLPAARRSVLEAIALGEASGERYNNALNLLALGMIEAREGDLESSGRWIADALRQLVGAGGHASLSIALDVVATLLLEHGEQERGARLGAAADRLRREVGGGPSTATILLEEPLDRAQRTMGQADFERAVAAGRAMTTDEAVAIGLDAAENGFV
jgi:predicted ATPase/class 3 adenylate cyclase